MSTDDQQNTARPLQISLFRLLQQEFGNTLPVTQLTKAALVEISHALENTMLQNKLPGMVFTGFQKSSHWDKEIQRYRELAGIAQSVCIFSGPNPITQPGPEATAEVGVVMVDLAPQDALCQEWFLLILSQKFSVMLCGLDQLLPTNREADRTFDTIFSFDPLVIERTLNSLEKVLTHYRQDKLIQIQFGRAQFPPVLPNPQYLLTLTEAFMRQANLYRPIVRQLDQNQAMMATIRTLLHETSQPLTTLLVLLDLFMQQGFANGGDLHTLWEATNELKTTLGDIRRTTHFDTVRVNDQEHLRLRDSNDVIVK